METPGDEPAIVFAEAAVRDRLRRVDSGGTTIRLPSVLLDDTVSGKQRTPPASQWFDGVSGHLSVIVRPNHFPFTAGDSPSVEATAD
jgi:hypothetical protein